MSTVQDLTWRLLMHAKGDAAESDRRMDAVVEVVYDLHAEVEALRLALLCSELANGGSESALGVAYRSVMDLTHDSCGPTGGMDKLLQRYYPLDTLADGRAWRERLMLERLGFDDDEILRFSAERRTQRQ